MIYFGMYKKFIEEDPGLIENGSLYEIAVKAYNIESAPIFLAPFIFSIAVLKNDFNTLILLGHPPQNTIYVFDGRPGKGNSIPIFNIKADFDLDLSVPKILSYLKEETKNYMMGALNYEMPKGYIQIVLDNLKVGFLPSFYKEHDIDISSGGIITYPLKGN